MDIERGTIGPLPYAAIGKGAPMLVIAGLMPYTGPGPDRMARAAIGWIAEAADRRRFVLVNRRPGLPRGMTMADIAAEHADAIRALGGRVDVMGTSTGGSIAQQLAADHPDLVGRLFLLSTACRLGPEGKVLQRRVAARIRAGARRQATAVMVREFAPLPVAVAASLIGPLVMRGDRSWDDLAATIEAEDDFDLRRLDPDPGPHARRLRTRRHLLSAGAVRGDGSAHPRQRAGHARRPRAHRRAQRPSRPGRDQPSALSFPKRPA